MRISCVAGQFELGSESAIEAVHACLGGSACARTRDADCGKVEKMPAPPRPAPPTWPMMWVLVCRTVRRGKAFMAMAWGRKGGREEGFCRRVAATQIRS